MLIIWHYVTTHQPGPGRPELEHSVLGGYEVADPEELLGLCWNMVTYLTDLPVPVI